MCRHCRRHGACRRLCCRGAHLHRGHTTVAIQAYTLKPLRPALDQYLPVEHQYISPVNGERSRQSFDASQRAGTTMDRQPTRQRTSSWIRWKDVCQSQRRPSSRCRECKKPRQCVPMGSGRTPAGHGLSDDCINAPPSADGIVAVWTRHHRQWTQAVSGILPRRAMSRVRPKCRVQDRGPSVRSA